MTFISHDVELVILWKMYRRADEIAQFYKQKFGLIDVRPDNENNECYDESYNTVPQFQQDVYGTKANNYLMKAIVNSHQQIEY